MSSRCTRCGVEFSSWASNDPLCPTCWRPRVRCPPNASSGTTVTDPPAHPPAPSIPEVPLGRRDEAILWLEDLLAPAPVPCAEVVRRAKEAKIAARTLRRAKKLLTVRSTRVGGLGETGWWEWHRPRAR